MSNMINLGTIEEHLGVRLSGEFVEKTLGVPPDEQEKRAKFWTQASYLKILAGLKNTIEAKIVDVEMDGLPELVAGKPSTKKAKPADDDDEL